MQRKADQAMIERMRQFRSEGKSNREIAELCNLSISTVTRNIGKQPEMLRASYGSVVAKVTDVAPVAIIQTPKRRNSSLQIVAQTKVLQGTFCHFSMDSTGHVTIAINNSDDRLRLNVAQMEALITELMDAYTELTEIR